MSTEYLSLAFKARTGNHITKLVLIKLADNANDQGICWPSYKTIAEQTETSISSVRRHVKILNDIGIIEIENKYKQGRQTTNIYRLNFDKLISMRIENIGGGQSEHPGGQSEHPGVLQENRGGCSPGEQQNHQLEPSLKEKNTKKENFHSNPSLSENEQSLPPGKTSPPDTKNQDVKKFDPIKFRPAGITEKDWSDLLQHRKDKKAKNTERALSALLGEIEAAAQHGYTPTMCIDEMIIRNWTGFKAEWIMTSSTKHGGSGNDKPVQVRKEKPIFFCAECERLSLGNCGKPSDKSCNYFLHINPEIEALRQQNPRGLQGTSCIIPEPAMAIVTEWRKKNNDLWTATI